MFKKYANKLYQSKLHYSRTYFSSHECKKKMRALPHFFLHGVKNITIIVGQVNQNIKIAGAFTKKARVELLPKYYYTMSYTTAMMKKHIKFIIGVIFSIILLTLCESWLFSDYEINWLEPINDQPDFDDFEHFDWNGDVR